MKNLFILILITFSTQVFSQTNKVVTKSTYENGNIKKEEVYQDTSLVEIRYYYENGHLKKSKSYKDGSRNGRYSTYYETGNLEYQGDFINGKPSRQHKRYYETGELREVREYNRDGELISFNCFDENSNKIDCE
jgi:antitoxin component YwqK of YwqJK toxin-antitoxin module